MPPPLPPPNCHRTATVKPPRSPPPPPPPPPPLIASTHRPLLYRVKALAGCATAFWLHLPTDEWGRLDSATGGGRDGDGSGGLSVISDEGEKKEQGGDGELLRTVRRKVPEVIDYATLLLKPKSATNAATKPTVAAIEQFYDIDAESADPRTREFLRSNETLMAWAQRTNVSSAVEETLGRATHVTMPTKMCHRVVALYLATQAVSFLRNELGPNWPRADSEVSRMRQRNGKPLVNLKAFAHRVSCERSLLKVLGGYNANGPIMLASADTEWDLSSTLSMVPAALKHSAKMLLRHVCGPARLYLDGASVAVYLEERLDRQAADGVTNAMTAFWTDESAKKSREPALDHDMDMCLTLWHASLVQLALTGGGGGGQSNVSSYFDLKVSSLERGGEAWKKGKKGRGRNQVTAPRDRLRSVYHRWKEAMDYLTSPSWAPPASWVSNMLVASSKLSAIISAFGTPGSDHTANGADGGWSDGGSPNAKLVLRGTPPAVLFVVQLKLTLELALACIALNGSKLHAANQNSASVLLPANYAMLHLKDGVRAGVLTAATQRTGGIAHEHAKETRNRWWCLREINRRSQNTTESASRDATLLREKIGQTIMTFAYSCSQTLQSTLDCSRDKPGLEGLWQAVQDFEHALVVMLVLCVNIDHVKPLLDQSDSSGQAITCIRSAVTGACLAWQRFLADPAGITLNMKDAAKTAKDMPDWAAETAVGRGIAAMNLGESRGVLQTTEQAFACLVTILEARGESLFLLEAKRKTLDLKLFMDPSGGGSTDAKSSSSKKGAVATTPFEAREKQHESLSGKRWYDFGGITPDLDALMAAGSEEERRMATTWVVEAERAAAAVSAVEGADSSVLLDRFEQARREEEERQNYAAALFQRLFRSYNANATANGPMANGADPKAADAEEEVTKGDGDGAADEGGGGGRRRARGAVQAKEDILKSLRAQMPQFGVQFESSGAEKGEKNGCLACNMKWPDKYTPYFQSLRQKRATLSVRCKGHADGSKPDEGAAGELEDFEAQFSKSRLAQLMLEQQEAEGKMFDIEAAGEEVDDELQAHIQAIDQKARRLYRTMNAKVSYPTYRNPSHPISLPRSQPSLLAPTHPTRPPTPR